MSIDTQNVAHHNVVISNTHLMTIANNSLCVSFMQAACQSNKCKLFSIVNASCDENHNANRQEDSKPFQPTRSTFLPILQRRRLHNKPNDTQNNEHNEDKILNSIPAQFEKRIEFFIRNGISTKCFPTKFNVHSIICNSIFRLGSENDRRKSIRCTFQVMRTLQFLHGTTLHFFMPSLFFRSPNTLHKCLNLDACTFQFFLLPRSAGRHIGSRLLENPSKGLMRAVAAKITQIF
mmetsp:Transcript_269/g.449  ORF Transcript_269/g.449 Transcript_269/m.449 type:complete len:234 (+) Transcript_269:2709-3410(+)